MFYRCARLGFGLAHGAVGGPGSSYRDPFGSCGKATVACKNAHAPTACVGMPLAIMEFAQTRCMVFRRTNTVRVVGLHKHGAAMILLHKYGASFWSADIYSHREVFHGIT